MTTPPLIRLSSLVEDVWAEASTSEFGREIEPADEVARPSILKCPTCGRPTSAAGLHHVAIYRDDVTITPEAAGLLVASGAALPLNTVRVEEAVCLPCARRWAHAAPGDPMNLRFAEEQAIEDSIYEDTFQPSEDGEPVIREADDGFGK